MKAILGIAVAMGALAWFLTFPPGCAVAPECKGDPALMPCSCMNPRSPQCPPVPMDTKRPDAGVDR